MKLTKEILKSGLDTILPKLKIDIENMYVFFPIDLSVNTTDEFGITTSKYKTESYYGNSYVPGIVVRREGSSVFCRLGYAATTNLVSFDLGGYMSVIYQTLTDTEKDFVCQYESCLVKTENCYCDISALYLK